jgi:hypothetical protein
MAENRQFKVKVLRIQGIGKRTHTVGQIVFETSFPTGVANELVKSGYLEEIVKEEKKEEIKNDLQFTERKEQLLANDWKEEDEMFSKGEVIVSIEELTNMSKKDFNKLLKV